MPDVPSDRLAGWKEIASYLARSVRTAQRWEREFSLPVRRLRGAAGATVRAYRSEIDAWCQSDRGRAAVAELPPEPVRDEAALEISMSSGDAPVALPVASTRPRRGRRGLAASVAVATGLVVVLAWSRAEPTGAVLACSAPCVVTQGQTVVLRADGVAASDSFVRLIQDSKGHMESFRPALLPDENGVVTWGFTTDCTSRPGVYQLQLRHETSGVPTNAVRIRIDAEPSCERPVADLVAEGMSLDRTAATPSESLTCRFVLRNQGAVSAPPSVARLRLGRSPDRTAVTDRALADVPVPAIPIGGAVAVHHTVRLPDDLSPGSEYYVWLVADNGSAVLERVSTNNFARSSALTVHARP